MPNFAIAWSASRTTAEGSFNAALEGSYLVLPAEIVDRLGVSPFKSVEEFLSTLHAFPTSFMLGMSWTQAEFERAKEEVLRLLEGKIAERWLRPPPPRQYGMGALPSPNHPVQEGYVVGFDDDPKNVN